MRSYEETKKFCEKMNKQVKENKCYDIYNITGTKELEDFGNHSKCVEENLMPDEHRWYIISANIYSYNGFFVGINHVSTIKNEIDGFEEIGYELEFFPVKPVVRTTYVFWNGE